MSAIKIFVGLGFLVTTGIVVKKYGLPLVPDFSIEGLRVMSMADILKLTEAIVFAVIITGFVLQECMHLVHKAFRSAGQGEGTSAARWGDLAYLLVAIAGSAFLYLAYYKAGGGA